MKRLRCWHGSNWSNTRVFPQNKKTSSSLAEVSPAMSPPLRELRRA